MKNQINFQWIKDSLFSDDSKKINLKKGEILLDYGQRNTRLYLVIKGKVFGYLKDAVLENYPIFEETDNDFIGVYSYFSDDHTTYSRVVAGEDTEVRYYDKAIEEHTEEELKRLNPFLFRVIVNEIFTRQIFAKKMAKEKHKDSQRLLKAEKMATLGQMAAGLAHELNNSVSVLDGGLDRLKNFIEDTVKKNKSTTLVASFKLGLLNGQSTSSQDARLLRERLESKISQLTSAQSRRLSKIGLTLEQLEKAIKKDGLSADQLFDHWEVGCGIHDMQIAARHATHVVKSMKQLGMAEHQWSKHVDINETINEALVILTNLTKRVETVMQLDSKLPATSACFGQLVQVWINLVKNGIESMLQGSIVEPKLTITSSFDQKNITIAIIDNGPGIPQNIISRIFEPSFTTKVAGLNFGLGLGLSIVQRIVAEHDATIEVTSGSGTTSFIVKLPIIN
ncbi:MAG: signal transduction histidine kinase [Marinoscillum sp.]|jgi:signal transduction histidine kinase